MTSDRPPGLARTNGYLNMVFRQRDPPRFYRELARRYGDVAFFRFGPVDSYLISHPDDVRDVFVTHARKFGRPLGAKILRRMLLGEGLLTSEGGFHLRQRRMIQPAFHRPRVAAYAAVMSDYTLRTSDDWRRHPAGEPIDMSAQMMRLTLAIVGKTLLDADIGHDAHGVGQAMDTLYHLFDKTASPLHILMNRLGLASNVAFRSARATLDDIVFRLISERRATGGDRGDLLSMLLMAADAETADLPGAAGTAPGKPGGKPVPNPVGTDAPFTMNDQQVRDEVMTLFLAGHETTAIALSWAWHLLATHPQVQEQLAEELVRVLAGRPPGFGDLPALPFTEAVFTETLRLYPPAWLLGRTTLTEHEIRGYRIAPRTTVAVSPWVIHRDPRFYADPDRFMPQRWTAAMRAGLPKLAFMPFGGGSRVCIGEGFAWAEGILVLATLAQHWRVRPLAGHPVTYRAMLTLRPRGGMPMLIEPRSG